MIGSWDNSNNIMALVPKAEGDFRFIDANTGFANTYNGPHSAGGYAGVLNNFASGYGYLYNSGEPYYRNGIFNDLIVFGDVLNLNSTNKFSMSFWLTQNTIDQVNVFFRKVLSATNEIKFITHSDGNLYLYLENGGASSGYFDYSVAVTSGVMFNLQVVYNGGGLTNADRLKCNINDVNMSLTFTGTIPATTPNLSGQDFSLGAASNSWDGDFNGFVYDDVAWSPEEASALYDLGPSLGGLIGTDNGDGTMNLTAPSSGKKQGFSLSPWKFGF